MNVTEQSGELCPFFSLLDIDPCGLQAHQHWITSAFLVKPQMSLSVQLLPQEEHPHDDTQS